MKQFLAFVKKEFVHAFRDRKTLLILFGMPMVQILLFGFALTNEIKNSRIAILDLAKDETSHKIVERISSSEYFEVWEMLSSQDELEASFREGKVRLALVIPIGFQAQLAHENGAQIQVLADASDPNRATALSTYVSALLMDFQSGIVGGKVLPMQIIPEVRMLYNPQLKGAPNFVPGVMSLVMMLICVMMTAVSIVREKELGTMEVLLVSPFTPIMVVLSKAVPYLIISFLNICSILFLSVFVLGLPIHGSLPLLLALSTLFIITALSMGLLISSFTSSQQAAMLASLMGMMLPTMIFTGFMFPIENMPVALQVISNLVPAKWFYIIVKAVMIKGVGFEAVWKETLILAGMTVFFLWVSFRKFKTRLA